MQPHETLSSNERFGFRGDQPWALRKTTTSCQPSGRAHASHTPRSRLASPWQQKFFGTVKANVCGSERDTSRAERLLPCSEWEDWHRVRITSSSKARDKHKQCRDATVRQDQQLVVVSAVNTEEEILYEKVNTTLRCWAVTSRPKALHQSFPLKWGGVWKTGTSQKTPLLECVAKLCVTLLIQSMWIFTCCCCSGSILPSGCPAPHAEIRTSLVHRMYQPPTFIHLLRLLSPHPVLVLQECSALITNLLYTLVNRAGDALFTVTAIFPASLRSLQGWHTEAGTCVTWSFFSLLFSKTFHPSWLLTNGGGPSLRSNAQNA